MLKLAIIKAKAIAACGMDIVVRLLIIITVDVVDGYSSSDVNRISFKVLFIEKLPSYVPRQGLEEPTFYHCVRRIEPNIAVPQEIPGGIDAGQPQLPKQSFLVLQDPRSII